MLMKLTIFYIRAAFAHADPKRAKNAVKSFFAFFDLYASKMLMKLTPGSEDANMSGVRS